MLNKKSNKGSDEKVNHKLDRGTHRVHLGYKRFFGPVVQRMQNPHTHEEMPRAVDCFVPYIPAEFSLCSLQLRQRTHIIRTPVLLLLLLSRFSRV